MPSLTIGLIGIGLLGSAIVERLASAGYTIIGYDSDHTEGPSPTVTAESAGAVFAACDTVILSLPNGDVVRSVVDAVRPALRPGQLVADTTTCSPKQTVTMATTLNGQQVEYVDATVAGSSTQLRDGTAAMFLGIAEGKHARFDNIVRSLTQNPFYLGDVGRGTRLKLVHNLVLGLNRAALAEGIRFGEALGFPAPEVLRMLQQTPASSNVMLSKGQKMATRDFAPQGLLTQHLKDVDLILEAAKSADAAAPFSKLHRRVLQHAKTKGFGAVDNSAVIEGLDVDL